MLAADVCAASGIIWRTIAEADAPALFRIYASTREDEMALVDWTPEQKHQFLAFQFHAQHTHYTVHFPDAELGLMERGGEVIGRLYVRETSGGIHILDVVLLPEHRNQGIGGGLLRTILERADAAGLPVTIHVEIMNPARALYERLGFRVIEERGMYLLLEYRGGVRECAREEMSVCQ